MDSFTFAVILIFGTVIIIEAVNIFLRLPRKSRFCEYGFTAVVVLQPQEDIRDKINGILHKFFWMDSDALNSILLIDMGLNDEQRKICMKYTGENEFLHLVKPDKILEFIISSKKIM